MPTANTYDEMRSLAAEIRIKILETLSVFGSGHVGGSMSIADTMAVLYGSRLRYDANDPTWDKRDRLVMSKGHCGPALYSALALSGFFPTEWLATLNQPGTRLPSHCDRLKTPGIDVSTGSLGQGVSLACGLAMAGKIKNSDSMVYAIVGDGELQEGQVWEAFQFAAQRKLGRLVFLIDRNKMQLDGATEDISALEPLADKLRDFGMVVTDVDGHNVVEIDSALDGLRENPGDKPHAIILHTKKGAGYVIAEQAKLCHHMPVSKEDAEIGIAEIKRRLNEGLEVCGVEYDR